jgi:hypothetical protein
MDCQVPYFCSHSLDVEFEIGEIALLICKTALLSLLYFIDLVQTSIYEGKAPMPSSRLLPVLFPMEVLES